jgi:hypothetical protein
VCCLLRAQAATARSFRNELIFLSTDRAQAHLALNLVLNLRNLHTEHYILLADSSATCAVLRAGMPSLACVFSTKLEAVMPERSPLRQRALSPAFILWTLRKHYVTELATLGFNVLQSDSDVLWFASPYPTLKSLAHNIVLQSEGADVVHANGGLLYVRNVSLGQPAHWALAEIQRRMFAVIRDPAGTLNALYPGLIASGAPPAQARPQAWLPLCVYSFNIVLPRACRLPCACAPARTSKTC